MSHSTLPRLYAMKKIDYTQQLEKQLEELQEKLAMAQFEAEQYKEIASTKKGKLILIHERIGTGRDLKASFMCDIAAHSEKKMSGQWVYIIDKDRTGCNVGKELTLDALQKMAREG